MGANMNILQIIARRFKPQGITPEHAALLERGETQAPDDIALAVRMAPIQWQALTGTEIGEDETIT